MIIRKQNYDKHNVEPKFSIDILIMVSEIEEQMSTLEAKLRKEFNLIIENLKQDFDEEIRNANEITDDKMVQYKSGEKGRIAKLKNNVTELRKEVHDLKARVVSLEHMLAIKSEPKYNKIKTEVVMKEPKDEEVKQEKVKRPVVKRNIVSKEPSDETIVKSKKPMKKRVGPVIILEMIDRDIEYTGTPIPANMLGPKIKSFSERKLISEEERKKVVPPFLTDDEKQDVSI